MIIESAENLQMETIHTVRTPRGDEMRINADKLAIVVAGLIAEARHDRKMGWHLEDGFYRSAWAKISRAALSSEPHHG